MERESFKLFKEYSEATIVDREELALRNFLRFYQCGATFFLWKSEQSSKAEF